MAGRMKRCRCSKGLRRACRTRGVPRVLTQRALQLVAAGAKACHRASVQLALNHSIHHRGQLSMLLRPMGAKVPSIYGESYDARVEREQKQNAS